MKFCETSFREYIESYTTNDFHPKYSTLYKKMPNTIKELSHTIFYGPSGVGKYTQVLAYMYKYSPSKLHYEKKIHYDYKKKYNFLYKLSDIHYEIDFALLGCNARDLWNELYIQINDILKNKKNQEAFIVCKNFHTIHSELLEIFYNYMQYDETTTIQIRYILITESISFIPDNILEMATKFYFPRPSQNVYKKSLNQIPFIHNDNGIYMYSIEDLKTKYLDVSKYDTFIDLDELGLNAVYKKQQTITNEIQNKIIQDETSKVYDAKTKTNKLKQDNDSYTNNDSDSENEISTNDECSPSKEDDYYDSNKTQPKKQLRKPGSFTSFQPFASPTKSSLKKKVKQDDIKSVKSADTKVSFSTHKTVNTLFSGTSGGMNSVKSGLTDFDDYKKVYNLVGNKHIKIETYDEYSLKQASILKNEPYKNWNFKDVKLKSAMFKDKNELLCDDLFTMIENYELINYNDLREHVYKLLIYQVDIQEAFFNVLQKIFDYYTIDKEYLPELQIKLYEFLKYYNNNYRPIFHLERISIYISSILYKSKIKHNS